MTYKQQVNKHIARINHNGTITIPKKYVDKLHVPDNAKLFCQVDRQRNCIELHVID